VPTRSRPAAEEAEIDVGRFDRERVRHVVLLSTEIVEPDATLKQSGLNALPCIVSGPESAVALSAMQPPPDPPQAALESASTATIASRHVRRPSLIDGSEEAPETTPLRRRP
jgi:hypothetical protein